MRTILAGTLFLSMTMAGRGDSVPPRPVPEFTVHFPDGTQTELRSFAGKVIVVQLISTICQHCQHTAQVISTLQAEYGSRGFQPVGIAFNENAITLVPAFVRDFKIGFPVGVSTRESLAELLRQPYPTRLVAPQIVIIDRSGMIRFQSRPDASDNLHEEASLREKIELLLKEETRKHASSAVGSH
jgi:peroxiredoxin